MDIYSVFKETVDRFSFIPQSASILVAYSGGKDSTALLHLFLMLAAERKLTIHAAYVNHGIRADAAEEENWVRTVCEGLGVPLRVEHTDIPDLLKSKGGNLEELASGERYRLLHGCLESLPQPAFLATAHHAGDQLETFLFRLARGSGPQGMLGIAAQLQQRVIRPMLTITPDAIVDFLSKRGISFYTDSSNDDLRYSRNRIRRRVLPELEQISTGLYSGFTRAQALLGEEDAYLQLLAGEALKRIRPMDGVLLRRAVGDMHPALARRVLRLFVAEIRGSLRAIEHRHLDGLYQALVADESAWHLPGVTLDLGRRFISDRGIQPRSYCHRLFWGQKRLVLEHPAAQLRLSRCTELKRDPSRLSVTLPVDKLIFPLTVRSLQNGDRYRRGHTDFRQKVTEMLRERGIPKGLRFLFPLLVNGDGEPIWCYACPLSATFHSPQTGEEQSDLLRVSWAKHPFAPYLSAD